MKNLPLSLAMATTLGALTLLRPADWSPAVRRAYVAVPGAAIAVGTAVLLRRGAQAQAEGPRMVLPLRARAILSVGAGAVTCAAQAVSLVTDKRIEAWLSRHGVARPRIVMGAVVALSSVAMDLAQKDSPAREG